MKGITPVIAIILLLLITVSMAGFAFVFLQRTLEQTTDSTEQGLQTQLNQQGQTFKIDKVDDRNNAVWVRYTGSVMSNTSSVTVYINDVLQNCAWGGGRPEWAPGSAPRACGTGVFACPVKIRITAPGGSDSITC